MTFANYDNYVSCTVPGHGEMKCKLLSKLESLRPCLYDPSIPGCPGCPGRISSRVYMISVHRDVPGDRDVSISLKKAWKS